MKVKYNVTIFFSIFFLLIIIGILYRIYILGKINSYYHAGFQVYFRNIKQDITGLDFMTQPLCEQKSNIIDKFPAHLYSQYSGIVHIHKPGIVWKELFQRMKIQIPSNNITLIGYINGEKSPNMIEEPIRPYDSIVIFLDHTDTAKQEELVKKRISKKQILDIEKLNQKCFIK
ncbi:MAG: hypothetical protein WCO06_05400 [Candidatus Roizmanbacteria bacterium]